jgi:hypothetical protein
MHFSPYLAAAILAAVPSGVNCHIAPRNQPKPTSAVGDGNWGNWGNSSGSVWVTETVTAYKTYCPSATKFTKGTKTYTATQQTWVTVTDCLQKCTISYQPTKPSIAPVGPPPKSNYTMPIPPPIKPTASKNSTMPVKPTPAKNSTMPVKPTPAKNSTVPVVPVKPTPVKNSTAPVPVKP